MTSTWECELCYTRNESLLLFCSFCEAPLPSKPHNAQKSVEKPSLPISAPQIASTPSKAFTWECRSCFILNPFKVDRCEICQSPRFASQNSKKRNLPLPAESEPVTKKPLTQEIDDGWTCRFCTLINDSSQKECLVCETPKQAKDLKLSTSKLQSSSSGTSQDPIVISIDEEYQSSANSSSSPQSSQQSTVSNNSSNVAFADALKGACVQCEQCGCEFSVEDIESLKEHAALHISGSSAHFTVVPESSSNTTASTPSSGDSLKSLNLSRLTTAYEYQYARSYSKAFSRSQNVRQMQERLDRLSMDLMIVADTETMVTGVMEALSAHMVKFSKSSRDFILASKVAHFSSGHGDRGWGCGYRNIQMLCSSLMNIAHYQKLLFGGIGYVPMIPVLQQSLEAAWAAGFDPGSSSRKNGVFGGNKWIGTYDAVAMLRNFGVPMELQTFSAQRRASAGSSATATHGNASRSGTSTTSSNIVPFSSFKYRRYQPAMFVPHVEMFKWVWSYFEKCKNRGDKIILPLYLQHDGHSRSIVGAEKTAGQIALLLFDPSFPPQNIVTQLQTASKVPDVVRKTLSEFRHENYQIAYVEDPSVVITPEMRAQRKIIKQMPIVRS